MKKIAVLILSILIGTSLSAQTNYIYGLAQSVGGFNFDFIRIDPASAVKTAIKPLATINGYAAPGTSTMNVYDSTYSFVGYSGGTKLLIQLDIKGNILNSNSFPDNVIGHEFNPKDSLIYAIWENSGVYTLVTVDPATGNKTTIKIIPNVSAYIPGTFTLDSKDQEYNFLGLDISITKFYNIDLTTGNVLNNKTFTENIAGQRYNCGNDTIYGLWEDMINGTYHLVWVNPSNSQWGIYSTITGASPGIISDNFSIDVAGNAYNFAGFTGNFPSLFNINTKTKKVANTNTMSFKGDAFEQINRCSIQVGVKPKTTNDRLISIFPNPVNGNNLQIINSTDQPFKIELFNLIGQNVYQAFATKYLTISHDQLNFFGHVLIYKITLADEVITGKMVIQ